MRWVHNQSFCMGFSTGKRDCQKIKAGSGRFTSVGLHGKKAGSCFTEKEERKWISPALKKIAQYLTHPLALIGFVLMLVFGMHKEIVKSGLLPQVSKKDGSEIIKLILRYGFWLGLVLVLAGFLLQFSGIGLSAWNSYMEKEKVVSVDAGKTAERLFAQLDVKDRQIADKDEQIKALTEAITALAKTDAPAESINEALQELEQGDTAKAQAIFAEVLRSKEAEGKQANKEAAAAARHLGALAYMNNPKEALIAYQKAVQLDPDDAAGWNRLGLICFSAQAS